MSMEYTTYVLVGINITERLSSQLGEDDSLYELGRAEEEKVAEKLGQEKYYTYFGGEGAETAFLGILLGNMGQDDAEDVFYGNDDILLKLLDLKQVARIMGYDEPVGLHIFQRWG